LPSWSDGRAKQSILDFVAAVTREGSAQYVPVPERIATFDNDGTLWVEQPIYTQLAFVLDRIKALAPTHPEWQDTQPFKAALAGDMEAWRSRAAEPSSETQCKACGRCDAMLTSAPHPVDRALRCARRSCTPRRELLSGVAARLARRFSGQARSCSPAQYHAPSCR
jgi:hypothetical protein